MGGAKGTRVMIFVFPSISVRQLSDYHLPMALTRSFRETIQEQLADSEFRSEFLREAVRNIVAGDLETAKAIVSEYIIAEAEA